jgi:hypothetical protein
MKFEKGTKYLAYSGRSVVGQFSAETAEVLASKPSYRGITWQAIAQLPIPANVKKASTKAEDKAAIKAADANDETNIIELIPADREDQRGAGGPTE